AHGGNDEEQWLLRAVAGVPPTDTRYADIYDAFRHPRRDRPQLAMLGPREARGYIAGVRSRVLDVLDDVALQPGDPLLDEAFVYGMVVQHEHQHDETMLATLQLRDQSYPHREEPAPAATTVSAEDVLVEGGPFVMGTDLEPWAYDNERPAHEVDLAPFRIDTAPVTNRAYVAFVDGGGYGDRRVWTEAGWAWRQEAGLEHPGFW